MEWPLKDPAHPNKFVTTPTNQEIWLRVAGAALQQQQEDAAKDDGGWQKRLQEWIVKVKQCSSSKWRFAYRELIGELLQIMSEIPSPQLVVDMCQAGLQATHDLFNVRITSSSSTVTAQEAFFDSNIVNLIISEPLKTVTCHGSTTDNDVAKNPWFVAKDSLPTSQLEAWATFGCMESSAAKHAARILDDESKDSHHNTTTLLENLSQFAHDKIFVLLGATSEMGPSSWLMNIPGAHLLAIARPGTKLQALVSQFQAMAHTSTTLQIPTTTTTNTPHEDMGVDMLTHGPHIARWIIEMAKDRCQNSPPGSAVDIVLCSLAYLDGEAHVRVSVAMDLIVEYVIQHWTNDNETTGGKVILWYLTSPTTVLAIPPPAAQRAQERYKQRPTWQRLLHSMSWGTWLQPTLVWQQATKEERTDIESDITNHPSLRVLNNLVTLQGPNYALAKTMQQWRCMVEDWRSSHSATSTGGSRSGGSNVIVIAPCGPPTRTQNMVSHPQIAASLDGLDYFPPMMAFSVQEASLLMTAILISMTREKCQQEPVRVEEHPMTLFWEGSVHGGYWECPYQSESSGVVTYVLGSTIGKWKTKSTCDN